MTLTEFLLARIAEDETDARSAMGSTPGDDKTPSDWWVKETHSMVYAGHWVPVVETAERSIPNGDGDGVITWRVAAPLGHIARHDPARVLAECEAKRRIADMHTSDATWDGGEECAQCSFHEAYEGFNDVSETFPCTTLRLLALPYADHPDYDEKWRP